MLNVKQSHDSGGHVRFIHLGWWTVLLALPTAPTRSLPRRCSGRWLDDGHPRYVRNCLKKMYK